MPGDVPIEDYEQCWSFDELHFALSDILHDFDEDDDENADIIKRWRAMRRFLGITHDAGGRA
jgi:hypothetical protein